MAELLGRGYVTPEGLQSELDAIETDLYRFPAVDPPTLRRAVADAIGRRG